MARLRKYFIGLLVTVGLLLFAAGVLSIFQRVYHPFDGIIRFMNQDLSKISGRLSFEIIGGVSAATIALLLGLGLFPLLHRGVNGREYLVSIGRHILAAFVFLGSELIYGYFEGFGRFYLLIAILASILVVAILVEIIARAAEAKEESRVRTELFSTIVGGLVIGILFKALGFALGLLGIHGVSLGGGH